MFDVQVFFSQLCLVCLSKSWDDYDSDLGTVLALLALSIVYTHTYIYILYANRSGDIQDYVK